MLLALIAPALADPPDRTRALLPVTPGAGTDVERMVVGVDGDIVVGRVRGTLEGWLLDVDSWEILTFGGAAQGCEVTGVAPIRLDDGTDEIWMSCGDGSVRGKWWNGRQLVDVEDEDGQPIVFEGVDETLSGLWYYAPPSTSQAALLYAIGAKVDEPSMVHVIDPFLLTVDQATSLPSYPKQLVFDGFVEATVVSDLLVVAHGGRNLSYLQLGLDSALSIHPPLLQATGCDDMFPSPFEDAVYCVAAPEGDPTALGAAFLFRPRASLVTPLALGELIKPTAIGVSRDRDDGWLAVTGTQVKVWELDPNGVVLSVDPYFEGPPDAQNPIQEIETSEGYLFGGGVGGNLHVVSARPWVYPATVSVTPLAAVDGDTVELKFTIDEATSWEIRIGGGRDGGGTRLAQGDAAADVEQLVTLTVDDRWAEGDNEVFVIATNADGLIGHGQATVSVDNPPAPPLLGPENLQLADAALILTFPGIPDEDLDRYDVYVSDAPFSPSDWPSGGPSFDGGRLKTPIQIPSEPGARVTHRIQPLENDVTYHVAVRAWDDGGKEGPMSRVLSGSPQQTYSVSEYVGDPGGSPCSTGAGTGGWLALVGVSGVVALRRRRLAGAAAAALAVLGLTVGAPAHAQGRNSDDEDPWWRQDTTPARANFQIRYGVINLHDERLEGFFTEGPANLLQAEIGPQLWRIGEIDFGFGFLQELSFQRVKGSLAPAPAERTMLTWFPLSIDATLRAHILDEQPAVPFVRYGWDYVIWSEKWDNNAGTKDTVRGAKFGTHTAFGVDLLLDLLQPGRASFLEAQTGINDSWITLEWRRQRVDSRKRPWSGRAAPEDRLDFSGDAFMVGLKLDW